MLLVEYSSNNSGGGWWLKDADWIKLAEAGWSVVWGGRKHYCGNLGMLRSEEAKRRARLIPKCAKNECNGHVLFDSNEEMTDEDRYLGALACEATKFFVTPREAIEEFERITGQDASDEGCNCCGPPHQFSWRDVEDGKNERGYASGESALPVLYDEKGPASLRDAYRDRYGR